jgi:hypothetical protein
MAHFPSHEAADFNACVERDAALRDPPAADQNASPVVYFGMRDPIFLVDRMRIDRRRAESWWRSYTDRHRSLLENRSFFDRKSKDGVRSCSGAGHLFEMPQRCVQTLYLMSLLQNSSSARFFSPGGVVVAGQAGAVGDLEHDGERVLVERRQCSSSNNLSTPTALSETASRIARRARWWRVRLMHALSPPRARVGGVVFSGQEGSAESVVYNDCLTPELPPTIINGKKQH